jgi:hypothetical protein
VLWLKEDVLFPKHDHTRARLSPLIPLFELGRGDDNCSRSGESEPECSGPVTAGTSFCGEKGVGSVTGEVVCEGGALQEQTLWQL